MLKGKLYIIGTPIGNLADITERAKEILSSVDLILCEDTRHTSKLLQHLKINKKLVSWHQHSRAPKLDQVKNYLAAGQQLALVTDAGTPGIADPGGYLVQEIAKLGYEIEPIPGPSALTTALSVCGLPTDQFLFLGFLPHKKGRQTMIREIINSKYTVVVYESVHRIQKLISELITADLGEKRRVVLGKELTKVFAQLFRGSISQIQQQLTKEIIKGEWVVIIEGSRSVGK